MAERPNELVLTEEIIRKAASKIVQKIYVRFFTAETIAHHLPEPYSRNGTSDFYFIRGTTPSATEDVCASIDVDTDAESTGTGSSELPPLRQGLHPFDLLSSQQLRGMGIFCSGGISTLVFQMEAHVTNMGL